MEYKTFYFKLKFRPDRENREMPSDSFLLADEPGIYEMLRYRNEMRLYYLNWVDVWETYSYITTWYVPFLVPIVWFLCGSWIAGLSLLILWAAGKRFIIGRNKKMLWSIKILIPGLFDNQLQEYFGPLQPFSGNNL